MVYDGIVQDRIDQNRIELLYITHTENGYRRLQRFGIDILSARPKFYTYGWFHPILDYFTQKSVNPLLLLRRSNGWASVVQLSREMGAILSELYTKFGRVLKFGEAGFLLTERSSCLSEMKAFFLSFFTFVCMPLASISNTCCGLQGQFPLSSVRVWVCESVVSLVYVLFVLFCWVTFYALLSSITSSTCMASVHFSPKKSVILFLFTKQKQSEKNDIDWSLTLITITKFTKTSCY